MYNTLLIYFIFLFFVAVVLLFIAVKLQLKNPFLFMGIIVSTIILSFLAGYLYFAYFNSIPEAIVPDIIGMNEGEAIKRIEDAGLKAKIEAKYDNSIIVTNQHPEPGKVVKIGRIISITIGNYEIDSMQNNEELPPTPFQSPL
ncbi:hypothetical protein A2230_03700 [candidate division WOR-1 bacterium RIFOXYA2_FULL_36_21]|uniref:PASTA domain-containing protein n=1 Tax=candidate division WOR-1 bacterium RIFOXYB2_FULL_36_35 TaxID=1802578 RepID=A0A1F4S1Z3_UNCSA|nr:MAG: hypothetical protein A2230_03700 [candidate division WOR-1 bacterium RIFOXYA2_FULL_36_21]OGC14430.1 MAG: hypothetical protein A2290_08395 [candidate division WOR-1 bacterium RIFOXYB2_FULL_36_35]OGC19950.1 MAG: hypothetical protein A2282_01720 [candidate division WOR-1 bacterium RIFOXYA12_FULL_36_13]